VRAAKQPVLAGEGCGSRLPVGSLFYAILPGTGFLTTILIKMGSTDEGYRSDSGWRQEFADEVQ